MLDHKFSTFSGTELAQALLRSLESLKSVVWLKVVIKCSQNFLPYPSAYSPQMQTCSTKIE